MLTSRSSHGSSSSGLLGYRYVVETCRGGATSCPALRKSSACIAWEEMESLETASGNVPSVPLLLAIVKDLQTFNQSTI